MLCINTKRQYIGHSSDVQQRLTIHKYELRHNKHFCFDLQEDFNRYGESSFVFERIALGESYPKQERKNLETCLIKLIPKEFLYNKFASPNDRRGKLGANFGNRHSLETKEQIRAAKSGSCPAKPPADVRRTRSAPGSRSAPRVVGAGLISSYVGESSDKRLKPVSIDGIAYNSVSQAHRETGIARRLIRQRCWSVDHPSYTWSHANDREDS